MHPRQAIREAVKAQLLYKTGADDRVFTTREVPWKKTDLPGIAVYTLEESAEQAAGPGDLKRHLTLAVVGVVSLSQVGNALDSSLDALALQIERAIDADLTLGKTACTAELTSTQVEVAEEEGRPLGVVRLVYTVPYFTQSRTLAR